MDFKKDISEIDSSSLVIVDRYNNPYISINETYFLSTNRFIDSKEINNYQFFIERDSGSLIKYFFWPYKNSINGAKIRMALLERNKLIKWGSPQYNEIIGCSDEFFLLDFSKAHVDSTMLDSLMY